MNDEIVMQDMNESSNRFMSLVAPIVAKMLSGGSTIQVEHKGEEIAELLDTQCGIDYMHIYKKLSLTYGIAARVQTGKNWETFTVRKERQSGARTEYEKRKAAIKKDGIYPYLTVQAYITDGKVEGVGVMRTKDLYDYIELDSPEMEERITGADKHGQAIFLVCPWEDIAHKGFKIRVYKDGKILMTHPKRQRSEG